MNAPMFGVFLSPHREHASKTIEHAGVAEANCLDYVSIQDHPYRGDFLDPLLLIAQMAAVTDRLMFMTNVANLPLRPPQSLAKSAATLDILSGGRFQLGIGGGRWWAEIRGLGGPVWSPPQVVKAVDESISVMRSMWTPTESANFDGEIYSLHAEPGPLPDQRIKIWLGGRGRRMLDLVGRRADGWIAPVMSDFEEKPAAQDAIDRGAADAGRDPREIRRAIQLVGAITSDGPTVARRLSGPNTAPLLTTPSSWAQTIIEFLTLGRFDTVNFIPVDETSEQIHLFGAEVIPRVREQLEGMNVLTAQGSLR